ncbi:MAG TPA: DUF924 family protein [Dongiaceae bacterium]|jgi:uncharacterized protein (DUF924 family)|nr:DUF924 family protein [Dongiaceae bacterium]
MSSPRDILQFWFSERARLLWFEKDSMFDADIRARFEPLVHEAQMGGFEEWRSSPDGALALLLLIDQFARNLYRGQAKAYLGDARARAVAAESIARGFDQRYPFPDRVFFYLPFEHCETLANQDRYIALIEGCMREVGEAAAEFLDYAHRHRNIIKRFGRFPHRNEALGRETTEEEAEFLKGPSSSF